jgi:hypothetical protein
MEFLFTTCLNINDKDITYEVHFDKERYSFLPADLNNNSPAFSFKREHDEWQDQESISPQLKTQAINALENYLLAQH